MKYLLLIPLLCGCAASQIVRPYSKETTTTKDGTTTVRETSADSITGGTVETIKKYNGK